MKLKIQRCICNIIFILSCCICPLNVIILPNIELQFQSKNNISFNSSPPTINLSKLPPIDYESLYYDWYNPKIEMLIIAPDNESFINTVKPLMEWKNILQNKRYTHYLEQNLKKKV